MPVTAVSPTPRHALLVLARLSARYPLPGAGSRPSIAAHVCAQAARKLVVAALPWRAAEDEPLLSRYDLLDIRHRNDKRAVAENAAPDEELIGSIEPRAEPNRLDQAETPGRRVDPEAFAAAKPIVVIPKEGPGKLEVARHQHTPCSENDRSCSVEGVGARSWSARVVAAARNDYFSLWHVKGSAITQLMVANSPAARRFTPRDGKIAHALDDVRRGDPLPKAVPARRRALWPIGHQPRTPTRLTLRASRRLSAK